MPVTYIKVTRDAAGQRLDHFLKKRYPGVPASRIYRALRSGEVRVNKGRVKGDRRLVEGDDVRLPPLHVAEVDAPFVSDRFARQLTEAVLFEDESMMVLNKPAGFSVHGGSQVAIGLIEALCVLYPEADLMLAHRLDRDTSGCLLLAKGRQAKIALQHAFETHAVEKHYLTLLKGIWPVNASEQVCHRLKKGVVKNSERMVVVHDADDDEGQEARSLFRFKQGFAPEASLMAVQLETGRTHQIRVQAQALGHPVAGDPKYGQPAFNRKMRRLGLKRLFLHAARLVVPHPVLGTPVVVEAPLPEALARVLSRLKGAEDAVG